MGGVDQNAGAFFEEVEIQGLVVEPPDLVFEGEALGLERGEFARQTRLLVGERHRRADALAPRHRMRAEIDDRSRKTDAREIDPCESCGRLLPLTTHDTPRIGVKMSRIG